MRIELNGADRVPVSPVTNATDGSVIRPMKAAAAPADGVALSGAAQELRAYQRAAQDAPDVREELVAELKAKIAAGQYHPPAEDIARKMLGG
ncbi:MAG: hypothetical protein KatS3mg060_0144 [Dehalococcoidia bacterium]|nr:MAG: hypothetical protein KatS3mg060_0144 [Dehalococcoidia bacterium]